MGVALTDVLVALSNPLDRERFRTDPEKFLAGRGLSSDEKEALLSGSAAMIWRNAQSVASDDPLQQFNRLARRTSDLLVEIDPVVEVHVETNSQTADHPEGRDHIFVDQDGRLFRLQVDA